MHHEALLDTRCIISTQRYNIRGIMKFDRIYYQKFVPQFLQSKELVFFMVTMGTLMDLLNVTAILVSVDYIHTHFNVSPAVASWSLSAYAVTFSGFIAFAGRIGDILGHDLQFIIGSFLFGIISLICAVVDNVYVFIIFRAFQGLAAALLIPSAYAMVAHLFEGKKLSFALTMLSGMICLGQAVGLVIGGAFIESGVKYRGVLYLSFGLSIIMAITGFFTFSKVDKSGDKLKDLDFFGSSVLIGGLLLIIVGFTEAGENWNSPKAYVTLPVGFLMVGVFLFYETLLSEKLSPSTQLLIPKEVWTIPNFIPLAFNAILNYGGFFVLVYTSISYYLNIDGNNPLIAGIKYLPSMITLLVFTIIMVKLQGKASPKWVATLSFVIGTVGMILMSRVDYKIPNQYWKFSFTGQILLAAGSVVYFIQYLNLIMMATPLKFQGIVSGICQTFAQFGTALAFAVITSIVGRTQDKVELNHRYQICAYFGLACYATGTLVILLFVHDVKTKPLDEEERMSAVSVDKIKIAEDKEEMSFQA